MICVFISEKPYFHLLCNRTKRLYTVTRTIELLLFIKAVYFKVKISELVEFRLIIICVMYECMTFNLAITCELISMIFFRERFKKNISIFHTQFINKQPPSHTIFFSMAIGNTQTLTITPHVICVCIRV